MWPLQCAGHPGPWYCSAGQSPLLVGGESPPGFYVPPHAHAETWSSPPPPMGRDVEVA